jgi:predicted O-linked N-acetylglucosamine transferase (SPINDLY family)
MSAGSAGLARRAVAAYASGDLGAAEALGRASLASDDRQFDALRVLAAVHLRTGRRESGLELVGAALRQRPGDPDCLALRGTALLAGGRASTALQDLERAVAAEPARASHRNNLGNALKALGRLPEAEAQLRRAVGLDPQRASAHTNLGATLNALGRPAAALDCHERAAALAPGLAEAWANRGSALLSLQRPIEALESYRRALDLQPALLSARHGVCVALDLQERHAEALAFAEEILARAPGETRAVLNRAIALRGLGRLDDALEALRAAAGADDAVLDADLLSALGNALQASRLYAEAEAVFVRLRAASPHYAYSLGRLLDCKLLACSWSGLEDLETQIRHGIGAGVPVTTPFSALALQTSAAEQLACARAFTQRIVSPEIEKAHLPAQAHPSPLRVAYVSPDFREHPVANQIARLLEVHDRARVQVYGVALESDDGSTASRRVRAACDVLIDATSLSDAQLVERLREERIDIAVDLAGHTLGSRLAVFARRVAPVQVNYLGFPGTLGTAFHDYLIADRHVVPPGEESGFAECVARLPHSYQPYDPQDLAGRPAPSRERAGLPRDAVVYCCFNNHFKVVPSIYAAWMRILQEVPGAVLWVAQGPAATLDNLRVAAAEHGIDPQRIVMATREADRRDHLARYAVADLFLDSLPFNAHATASDALWAGVPVLTRAGSSFAGRVAAGMVAAVGLHDLIAPDLEAYVAKAVQLGLQPQERLRLRERLRDRAASPLFDIRRYAADLEQAYQRMWDTAVSGAPPAGFDVAAG